jgi:hypothetical protein
MPSRRALLNTAFIPGGIRNGKGREGFASAFPRAAGETMARAQWLVTS